MKLYWPSTRASMVVVAFGAVLLSACTVGSAGSAPSASGQATATVVAPGAGASNHAITIPNNDIYAPYMSVLNAGDTVTWLNQDSILHTILTAPTTTGGAVNPEQFQIVLGPGKAASQTLRHPGLYYYYCDAHTTFHDQGPAEARPGMRAYPVPMDGFLYVLGPGISGVAKQSVIMSAEDRFTPWLTVTNQGGTVTWTNQTQRTLTVRGAPGYGLVNPTPLTIQLASGSSSSLTFNTVGIYDYYAAERASVDPIWMRPAAMSGAASYPTPMEGVVAVFP
jgi:plastocyanin